MRNWLQLLGKVLSGILNHPCNLVADDAVEGRIRAEQLNNIKRYLFSMMVANACNALVLVIAALAVVATAIGRSVGLRNSDVHTLSRDQKPPPGSREAVIRLASSGRSSRPQCVVAGRDVGDIALVV